MEKLITLLNRLEEEKIYYRLNKVRDAIMIEIAIPGERWEVEFMKDGTIEIERFFSNGCISGEDELSLLFNAD